MPYHILVIEDDADIQELIREFLTVQDYYVDVAGDGKEGIQKFMETNPDLLILDVMLPEMNGYQVLKAIRRNPVFP